jgi:two-component system, NarL family, nitrate/nitrite response regulator NarL
MTIGVVLADDHPIVLDGLAGLLALEPDINVLASCLNGEQALRAVIECRPDVLLLDLGLPDMDGIEVLRRLRESESPTRVVLLAAVITDEQAEEALQLRVDGMLLKELPPQLITSCIRKVHRGGRWLEVSSVCKVLDRVTASRTARDAVGDKVSVRELEVLRLVVSGLSNKQIAGRLFLSEGTVKCHLHHIYEKLQVGTRLKLAAYARDNHLI